MKIRAKILLLLTPLVVIPLLVLGWAAYEQLHDTTIQRSQLQMSTLLDQVRLHTQAMQQSARANIELFANSTLLEKYVVTADEEQRLLLMQPSLLRLFASYQHAYPEYYEIRILLPDGYEDTRSVLGDIPNRTDDEGTNPYFAAIQAHQSESFVDVIRNPDNGQPALLVSKALLFTHRSVDPVASTPRLRGYLVVTANLDFLQQQIGNLTIGKRGYMFVTDNNGRILFHPERTLIDHTLPAAQFAQLLKANADGGLRAQRLADDRVYIRSITLYDNLHLFAALPEQELQSASARLRSMVAMITLTAMTVTILLIYGALNSLLFRPIRSLGAAADEMGRGKLLTPIHIDSHDEIGALATAVRNMGKNLQQSHDQTHYLAYHDSLTGLPNRTMFGEYLRQAIAEARRHHHMSALMFLDLDDFKRINDTLGHPAGDKLLREVSQRLSDCLRREDTISRSSADEPTDMVARLGGDEFTIVLTHVAHEREPARVAQRLLEVLARPMILDNHEVQISSSIGITLYPLDGEDCDTLSKNADVAMYHAKQAGKNNFQYFSSTMNETAITRMKLESHLRHALEYNELSLHYQPQVDLGSGEIIGLEALLRWEHPQQGAISPATFIPVAEESGLIVPISEWVLRTACRQNNAWQQAGLRPVKVSVNVSGVQLSRQNLYDVVANALLDSGLAPEFLELELTETSLLEAQDLAATTLNSLQELGVEIALDDFGTGYSSLSYLKRLPIGHLKIDRSFVRDIHTDTDDAAIVTAIIAMGHGLNLRVTAEGVELEEQLDFLRQRKCDVIQGFLFSKPLPAPAMAQILRHGLPHRHATTTTSGTPCMT